MTPRPFQPLGPPIRIAATSPDSFISIGQQGKPIFMGVKFEDARDLLPNIQAYRKAWRDAGHPGNGSVHMRAPGYVAVTDAAARAEAEASLIHYYRQQAALLADSLGRAGVEGVEKRRLAVERLRTITYDEALRGSVIIGSPTRVADQLQELKSDLGLDGIMLEMNCGGQIPHNHEKQALRLLCQEVMPQFR